MKCFSHTESIYLQIPHSTLKITESKVPGALPLPLHSTVRVSLKSQSSQDYMVRLCL